MNDIINNFEKVVKALDGIQLSGRNNWARILGATQVIEEFMRAVSEGKITISENYNDADSENDNEASDNEQSN